MEEKNRDLEQRVCPPHDFVPFNEVAPKEGCGHNSYPVHGRYLYVDSLHERPQRVVLRDLPVGTLLLAEGEHRAAQYLMKVIEVDSKKQIALWKEFNSDGLIGPIDAISSIDREERSEKGIMELGKRFSFPYFRYNGKRVRQPKLWENWNDVYKVIRVLTPEAKAKFDEEERTQTDSP